MHKTHLLLATVLFGCGSSGPAVEAPSVSVDPDKMVRVYSGANGMEVSAVPLKSNGEPQFLVQVKGTDSKINGVVFKATKTSNGGSYKGYEIQLHGEGFWLLVEATKRGGAVRHYVTLPEDFRNKFDVTLSEPKSKELNSPALLEKHLSQLSDGTLPKLQAWNRADREKQHMLSLAKESKSASKACGTEITMKVDWKKIDNEVMKEKSVSGYCEDGVEAIERLCDRFADMKDQLKGPVTVTCSWDGGTPGLSKTANGYTWVPVESNSADKANKDARKLFDYERMVAKGPKGLIVYVDTRESPEVIYAGKGTDLKKQRRYNNGTLFGGRVGASLWRRKGSWKLDCGPKDVLLEVLPIAEKNALLEKAKLSEVAFDREPLYLARDSKGTYYYVDRLIAEKGGKDYRVFMGPKGAARSTTLKDIVDDSKGLIFSTKKGDLRLIVEKTRKTVATDAFWIKGKKRRKLTVLPVWDNRKLIFDDLGAYDGSPLGTICDDF